MPNPSPLQQPPTAAVYPSIPEPTIDPNAMLETLKRIKETVEVMAGQRGPVPFAFPQVIQSINDLRKKVVTDIDTIRSGTAEVKVYASAEGSVESGYQAIYGWRVTAGDIVAGMYHYVTDAGDAETVFTSSKFKLINSNVAGGAPQTIFNYDGGQSAFTFGVPVKIGSAEIGDLAVTTAKIDNLSVMNEKIYGNAVSSVSTATATTSSSVQSVSVTVTLRGTGAVLVRGYSQGVDSSSSGRSASYTHNSHNQIHRLTRTTAGVEATLISGYPPMFSYSYENGVDIVVTSWQKAGVVTYVDSPQTGSRTYTFVGISRGGVTGFMNGQQITIEVVELAK